MNGNCRKSYKEYDCGSLRLKVTTPKTLTTEHKIQKSSQKTEHCIKAVKKITVYVSF